MSAQFVVMEGPLAGLLLTLEGPGPWTLGRDPEVCTLLLEEPDIDRRQFLCRKVGEEYFLEPLSKSVPISLQGRSVVRETPLHEGDTIVVGKNLLRFTLNVAQEEARDEGAFDEPLEEEVLPEEEALAPAPASPQTPAPPPPQLSEKMEDLEKEAEEMESFHVDLTPTVRFILKVIAGPNTGAEFAIDCGKEYVIGTDTTKCDIVFHDLSVSKQHARLNVSDTGQMTLTDLESRNGVVVDQKKIQGSCELGSHSIVTLGTTTFFLIDREAPQETIASPLFEREPPPAPPAPQEEIPQEVKPDVPPTKKPASPQKAAALILSSILVAFATLFGFGIYSLSRTKEIVIPDVNYELRIHEALQAFPEVNYSYNKTTHKLFLVGHVTNGLKINELHYNLQGLPFLKGVDDHVVDDEAIWQEMNLYLSKNSEFKGVSMHSPRPGVFVLHGYLKTEEQAAALQDYLNLHFNYLSQLIYKVVIEERVTNDIARKLLQGGFGNIQIDFINGDLTLTGYIGSAQTAAFAELLKEFSEVEGVRRVSNFVVTVTAEQQVVDLNARYPGRFVVTGYSKHGDVNINVVVNGKILTRGDLLDGMTITSIQPHTIFLEREGLKYKLDYNK